MVYGFNEDKDRVEVATKQELNNTNKDIGDAVKVLGDEIKKNYGIFLDYQRENDEALQNTDREIEQTAASLQQQISTTQQSLATQINNVMTIVQELQSRVGQLEAK